MPDDEKTNGRLGRHISLRGDGTWALFTYHRRTDREYTFHRVADEEEADEWLRGSRPGADEPVPILLEASQCPKCRGDGVIGAYTCETCQGKGYLGAWNVTRERARELLDAIPD